MSRKKILFLTGTRADFGKLKPLMYAVEKSKDYECLVFVTGMHMLSRYGMTVEEVKTYFLSQMQKQWESRFDGSVDNFFE